MAKRKNTTTKTTKTIKTTKSNSTKKELTVDEQLAKTKKDLSSIKRQRTKLNKEVKSLTEELDKSKSTSEALSAQLELTKKANSDLASAYTAKINTVVEEMKELEEKNMTLNSFIGWIKSQKEKLGNKYGPMKSNLLFGLIMFIVFGVTLLASYGADKLVNVPVLSDILFFGGTLAGLAFCSYVMFKVNWSNRNK
jgi:chaperonin cofactor prefoldin